MTYEEQNREIQIELSELEPQIVEFEERVKMAKQLFYEYEKIRLLEEILDSLKTRKSYLEKKLSESPQKRKLTNFQDKTVSLIEKLPPLPDLEHVSGRLYLDRNGGCSTWAFILVVLFIIIFAIHLTVTGGWEEFLDVFR